MMLRGRGLRTINALAPKPARPRPAFPLRKAPGGSPTPHRALKKPTWFVAGFEQLALLEPRRAESGDE
jgi:hypothetical protein